MKIISTEIKIGFSSTTSTIIVDFRRNSIHQYHRSRTFSSACVLFCVTLASIVSRVQQHHLVVIKTSRLLDFGVIRYDICDMYDIATIVANSRESPFQGRSSICADGNSLAKTDCRLRSRKLHADEPVRKPNIRKTKEDVKKHLLDLQAFICIYTE